MDSRIGLAEADISNLEGGVAAAMALGSATIVPGKDLSMTASAATYGGASAFSASISGRLSDSVYLSGGVTTDSRSDRVGARAAVTFGL